MHQSTAEPRIRTGLLDRQVAMVTGVNVNGTFTMMQAVARVMRQAGRGRIVNVSSIAGKGFARTSNILYAGSKGALIAMTRVAAALLGPHGITVNAICPGLNEAEMMKAWLQDRAAQEDAAPADLLGRLGQDIALRRINTPADIASAVLFMVSGWSRNVTGQSLNVDGGMVWD
ncbi:MAG TPA: SDR family oxidoreductase [Ramlibacter sp.]|nr:SDR family oxidoreductase [Ramlibacter sp.]